YQAETPSDPDEMSNRFTDLVNDLGYSKTFYPHSRVTHYLNGLASNIYLSLDRNKQEETSRIIRFWKTKLRLVIRKRYRLLLYGYMEHWRSRPSSSAEQRGWSLGTVFFFQVPCHGLNL